MFGAFRGQRKWIRQNLVLLTVICLLIILQIDATKTVVTPTTSLSHSVENAGDITALTQAASRDLNTEAASTEAENEAGHNPEVEPGVAVLFPIFTLTIGVFAYFILSRWVKWLPYTAVMFIIGTVMSVLSLVSGESNVLVESVDEFWRHIDSELLLLVFLPGLIFKDAFSMDVHLFTFAFWQCFIFAFPLVLAGTVLTALVAYYLLPFGWSFDFCMMFGSILSATDPVAVAALLDQVGAPPRLMVHISGEALMNDGSAIVFFNIFSQRYLYELGVNGYGEEIDVKKGFVLFFQLALGGVAAGLLFAFGLIFILSLLKRRLNREENVVEVSAIFAIAYLCYFVADVVWGTSGVIATLTLGVTTKAFGYGLINDIHLVFDFWSLIEHLLNTILFTLGGLTWGVHISNQDDVWRGIDWGYMVMVYIFVTLIRAVLFFVTYPVTNSIGLKTNLRETLFQIWGGLRGAVGIALAISVDNTVSRITEADSEAQMQTHRLFGIVGGVAFLTLVINAPIAGPMLKKLGLADSGEVRRSIFHAIQETWRCELIDHMIRLLTQQRFHSVSFGIVRSHVSSLQSLTEEEFHAAVTRYHENQKHLPEYRPPKIEIVLPYIMEVQTSRMDFTKSFRAKKKECEAELPDDRISLMRRTHLQSRRAGVLSRTPNTVNEARLIFLEVLRASYEKQLRAGELAQRSVLVIVLLRSLDMAADDVRRGKPLNDWKYANLIDLQIVSSFSKNLLARARTCLKVGQPLSYLKMAHQVELSLAFIEAHKHARQVMKEEFLNNDNLAISSAETQVLMESSSECTKAEEVIHSYPEEEVERIVSHKFSTILLAGAAQRAEGLLVAGLLKNKEAEEFLEEIQDQLFKIENCRLEEHPGQIPNASLEQLINKEKPESSIDDAESDMKEDTDNESSDVPVKGGETDLNVSVFRRKSIALLHD